MSRPPDPTNPDPPADEKTTVLDKVRPTVVRRRVFEPSAANTPRTLVHVSRGAAGEEEEDDAGPPSSVNVARALASLRGDELRRLEEIVSADDDPASQRNGPLSKGPLSRRGSSSAMRAAPPASVEAPVASATTSKAAQPTVRLGPSIGLGDLALALGIAKQELVMALVSRGFFSLTMKSVLPRETARLAAAMFGFVPEDDDTIAHSAVHSEKKKKAPHDKPKSMPKPPTAKKPSAPKRSVNRGR